MSRMVIIMNDLISRQAAIETAQRLYGWCDTSDITDYRDLVVEALKVLPSAERKKGMWIQLGNTGLATCKCGYMTDRHSVYNFCPKCGSDMRKGEDDG